MIVIAIVESFGEVIEPVEIEVIVVAANCLMLARRVKKHCCLDSGSLGSFC